MKRSLVAAADLISAFRFALSDFAGRFFPRAYLGQLIFAYRSHAFRRLTSDRADIRGAYALERVTSLRLKHERLASDSCA